MFSHELITPTRITRIKEAGVRMCIGGGPAPGEEVAV